MTADLIKSAQAAAAIERTPEPQSLYKDVITAQLFKVPGLQQQYKYRYYAVVVSDKPFTADRRRYYRKPAGAAFPLQFPQYGYLVIRLDLQGIGAYRAQAAADSLHHGKHIAIAGINSYTALRQFPDTIAAERLYILDVVQ